MSEDETEKQGEKRRPFRVRLPGFITEEDVGLGDVIKRATAAVGIRPCGGCQGRAAALNRRVVITGRRGR
jgi:hypothetical protein